MKIVFVGSNPSHLGPDSPAIKNLRKWYVEMGITKTPAFINVSSNTTEGNRPLKKSEWDLLNLQEVLLYNKIVALGNTASQALIKLGVNHFKLPHPSPKNRVLNDKKLVTTLLTSCRTYLEY